MALQNPPNTRSSAPEVVQLGEGVDIGVERVPRCTTDLRERTPGRSIICHNPLWDPCFCWVKFLSLKLAVKSSQYPPLLDISDLSTVEEMSKKDGKRLRAGYAFLQVLSSFGRTWPDIDPEEPQTLRISTVIYVTSTLFHSSDTAPFDRCIGVLGQLNLCRHRSSF